MVGTGPPTPWLVVLVPVAPQLRLLVAPADSASQWPSRLVGPEPRRTARAPSGPRLAARLAVQGLGMRSPVGPVKPITVEVSALVALDRFGDWAG